MDELFAFLAASEPDAASSSALRSAVLARFADDRRRFSDILEASFSCDERGAHLLRFSYAFPGWRSDQAGVARAMLAWCGPFGDAVVHACRRVLRAARAPAVEQPLFGYASDGAGRFRVKLYLQFREGESAAAMEIAAGIVGRPIVASGGDLHLLGLDVGGRGLAGAKLYFVVERTAASAIGDPVTAALARAGVAELKNVLFIHRLGGPDDPSSARASEIDFALPENHLAWGDLRALAPVNALLARSPSVAALEARFPLRIRRVSTSMTGEKLNVYYVLACEPPDHGDLESRQRKP